uniref:Uncharacterized protein n=1 Tax=Glossina brevipalpis TaxID=37001 RepID=A0A1A9WNW5_9MUSC
MIFGALSHTYLHVLPNIGIGLGPGISLYGIASFHSIVECIEFVSEINDVFIVGVVVLAVVACKDKWGHVVSVVVELFLFDAWLAEMIVNVAVKLLVLLVTRNNFNVAYV